MILEPGTNSIDHKSKFSIREHIEIIINKLDNEGVLSPARRNWMATHLTEFVVSSTLKFIAGQKEHGDGIENVDTMQEMYGEIIDFLWYHTAHTHPLHPTIK